MKWVETVKDLIDRNRLLVAIVVAWVIISNLLYFSNVGRLSDCHDFGTSDWSSFTPDWVILWHKLILGYVSLYDLISEPLQFPLKGPLCSYYAFRYAGYLSFVSIPLATITLLAMATKWIRRA